jgi:hypothetical protein
MLLPTVSTYIYICPLADASTILSYSMCVCIEVVFRASDAAAMSHVTTCKGPTTIDEMQCLRLDRHFPSQPYISSAYTVPAVAAPPKILSLETSTIRG